MSGCCDQRIEGLDHLSKTSKSIVNASQVTFPDSDKTPRFDLGARVNLRVARRGTWRPRRATHPGLAITSLACKSC